MSTSAAVYVEKLERTVRVNGDGYPSHMLPTLERLVVEDLLEDFASRDEYSFLTPTREVFDHYLEQYGRDRYVVVENVGFSFPDDDSISLTTLGFNGAYSFENDENYEYVIRPDGEVIIWKGEKE